MKDLNSIISPRDAHLLESIYLSDFTRWSSYEHCLVANRFGFRTLAGEWDREGFVDNYEQVDSPGYLMNAWLKYPKFGHASVTDFCCKLIREDRMTRERGMELVREHDHKMDQKMLYDFLTFTEYTPREFWDIVDKFYNRDIFTKVNGIWELSS